MQFPRPRVLQCNRFILKTSVEHSRLVKDFEFDLYLGEERHITVDDKHYTAPAGAVVYRRPGEYSVSRGNYDCYVLTLDFEGITDIEQQSFRRTRPGPPQNKESNPQFADFPTVFMPKRINDIREAFKKIASCSYPSITNDELATLYTEELLHLLLADFKSHLAEEMFEVDGDYIQRICAFINQNYKRNITVDEIAKQVSLNKNYMIRIFKKALGKTPIEYLIEARLFYSTNLLISTSLPISEVAYECGFNSSAYFTKTFKERYSITPLEFRKKHQIM